MSEPMSKSRKAPTTDPGHYTVEFDEREGWLVITNPGGASAIVAENVAPWFGHFIVRVVGPVPNLWDAQPAGTDPAWMHTTENDPSGLYDDHWEPRHD